MKAEPQVYCSATAPSPQTILARPRLRIGTAAIYAATPLFELGRRLSSHAIHATDRRRSPPRREHIQGWRRLLSASRADASSSTVTATTLHVNAVSALSRGKARMVCTRRKLRDELGPTIVVGLCRALAQGHDSFEIVGQKDRREGRPCRSEARLGHKIETAHRRMGPAPTGMTVGAGAGHFGETRGQRDVAQPGRRIAAAVRREASRCWRRTRTGPSRPSRGSKSRPRRPMRRGRASSSA